MFPYAVRSEGPYESEILQAVPKRSHWAGVFIELVIVVVGVFIGLQVNNWNQVRADARLGQDYVRRPTRDLQENLTGLREEIAYYSAVLESVQRADEFLRAADPDPRALVGKTKRLNSEATATRNAGEAGAGLGRNGCEATAGLSKPVRSAIRYGKLQSNGWAFP